MAALTLSEKLDQLDARYQEMTQELSTPEVVTDSARFQKLAKQHSDLETIVNKHREFKQIEKDLASTRQMVVESEDAEMRHMAQEEENFFSFPTILSTTKTSSSKSAQAPAATKPASSPAISSACTRATPNPRAGKSKSWKALRRKWAG
jgi:PCRF domain